MTKEVKDFALTAKHPISIIDRLGQQKLSPGQSRYEECFNHVLSGLLAHPTIIVKSVNDPQAIVGKTYVDIAIKITDTAMQALYDKHQVEQPAKDPLQGMKIIK